jgi:3-deoxy-D-manno-octulosonic-acid transferase
MGVLPRYYSSAECTIVGGSFVPKVGGHNLLEPILYGSVPLFGPWTEKQEHQKSFLQEYGFGFCLKIDGIQQEVLKILNDQDQLQNYKKKMIEMRAHMQRPLQATLESLVF